MAREVILTSEIEKKLYGLASLNDELNGMLMYRRRQDGRCYVEIVYITGAGDEGHVIADQDKLNIANRFFEKELEYHFVKFHVHSEGTIRKYGHHYATHLSSGDEAVIKEQIEHDKEFMALLVTPEKMILSGRDNPTLGVIRDYSGSKEKEEYVHRRLDEAKIELGYTTHTYHSRMVGRE